MRKSSITAKIVNNGLSPRDPSAGFRRLGVSIAVCALVIALPCRGQIAGNDSLIGSSGFIAIDSSYESAKHRESVFYDQTNPLSMLLVGLINIYQRVFSAQEGSSVCQFRPSCSHYGSLVLKKYGPVQGTLMTGDRLLRCNPWTKGQYTRWIDDYHLYDPAEDHDLWMSDSL